MHNLLRYYSENRIKVWMYIIGILFAIFVIRSLNDIAKNELQNNYERKETTSNNVVSYRNESQIMVTKGNIPEKYQEEFGEIIDEFYTYCINHEPEKAYELLAPETKRLLYPTEKQFENLYYKEKFEGNKNYTFQAWSRSISDVYIYQVKIFENMLATGKYEYIEDYVTIVPIEDTYKLNINSYIGRKNIKQKQENELLTAEVNYVDIYLDYEIYTLSMKNNTEQTILLDTREESNTTYITDSNNNDLESFLYEKAEKELMLDPQEFKTIQIKFNNSYRSNNMIKSINFIDIVDYEQYIQDKNIERYDLKIDM